MELDMILHQDAAAFKQAIQFTSDQLGIPAIYIEKDYWVTYALFKIVNDPVGSNVVFKGGTSLSKCFKIVERFSEDIDLVVLRQVNETDAQLKKKLKSISNAILHDMPEEQIDGITRKMGMNRKTAHSYPKLFNGAFGQVRDIIILESTWLGYFEPYSKRSINSLIGEVLEKTGQVNLIKQFGLQQFEMNVLEPIRTICEKIMSLVRFSYTENSISDLKSKIRHTYDLHQLLTEEVYKQFIESKDFETMLLKVAQDDVKSFKNNNSWLENHPNESLFFKDLSRLWEDELKSVYEANFRNLVYGELPKNNAVLETLKLIKNRMKQIQWNISLPK